MSEYPEHDKMQAVKEQSQAIGEFLEDPNTGQLCELVEVGKDMAGHTISEWHPRSGGIERILADYFDIDLNKIEAEKRAMLDKIREANQARMPIPPDVDEFAPADEPS